MNVTKCHLQNGNRVSRTLDYPRQLRSRPAKDRRDIKSSCTQNHAVPRCDQSSPKTCCRLGRLRGNMADFFWFCRKQWRVRLGRMPRRKITSHLKPVWTRKYLSQGRGDCGLNQFSQYSNILSQQVATNNWQKQGLRQNLSFHVSAVYLCLLASM